MGQSPLAPAEEILLERTPSGTIRIPPLDSFSSVPIEMNGTHIPITFQQNPDNHHEPPSISTISEDRRTSKQNLDWIRLHAKALQALALLPFDNADMFKLHQYFFSPVEATSNGVHETEFVNSCHGNNPMETDL